MGVYINGLKMPESCKECPFKTCFIRVNIKSYTCLINGGECEKTDCPLIEIDLVRCGECKYHDEDGWGYGNCQRPSVDYLRTADEDFCSYRRRSSIRWSENGRDQ